MTDEEFEAEAVSYLLKKFEESITSKDFYSICDATDFLSDNGVPYTDYRNVECTLLHRFHCRNWDTMSPELKEEVIARTKAWIGKLLEAQEKKKKSWVRRFFS